MKKLFEKAKLDYKFKKAGEGHTLTGNSSTASQQQATSSAPAVPRAAPSSDAQRAGQVSKEICGHFVLEGLENKIALW